MNKEKILGEFKKGLDCSQVVLAHFAKDLGISVEEARRVSAGFGGGMYSGDKCGAVTGAYMVLGYKYGHYKEGDAQQKQLMISKVKEFDAKFREFSHSDICREMLGHDISIAGEMEKAMEKGLLFDYCPRVVEACIKILEEIL